MQYPVELSEDGLEVKWKGDKNLYRPPPLPVVYTGKIEKVWTEYRKEKRVYGWSPDVSKLIRSHISQIEGSPYTHGPAILSIGSKIYSIVGQGENGILVCIEESLDRVKGKKNKEKVQAHHRRRKK